MGRYRLASGLPSYANYPGDVATEITAAIDDPRFKLDTLLDLDFLAELRRRWKGKLILKGVLDPRDAQMAFRAGCDAIVVSSHGGRNHDAAVTPLEVLPYIREAVGSANVLADSGVQRGSDAAKLLAAGADGVMLGRIPLYGLAAEDKDGAIGILRLMTEELTAFMAFSGAPDLAALSMLQWSQSREREVVTAPPNFENRGVGNP